MLQFLGMIADLPPIPHCVQDVTQLQYGSIILSGKAEAVTKWLSDPAVTNGPFKTSLSKMDARGRLTAILLFPSATAYRSIGKMVFEAQRNGLTVGAWTYEPPLCKPVKGLP